MIDQALIFHRDELNAYLLSHTNSADMVVKLSKVVNDFWTYAFPDDSISLIIRGSRIPSATRRRTSCTGRYT